MIIQEEKKPEIFDKEVSEMTLGAAKRVYNASYNRSLGGVASFVRATQDFGETIREVPTGLRASVGQAQYAVGEFIQSDSMSLSPAFGAVAEILPIGGKIFNGTLKSKIGNSLKEMGAVNIKTANRNLEMMRKEFEKEAVGISPEDRESLMYSITSQGYNYATVLGLSMLHPAAGLGFMSALTQSGETTEGMEIYKQRNDGSIEGFEKQSAKELALNTANTAVQTVLERAFGAPGQLNTFKTAKDRAKTFIGGFIDEFSTENAQNITDAVFDKLNERFEQDETIWSRVQDNFRDTVIAGMFGGTSGYMFASYNRAKGIEVFEDIIGDVVPSAEKNAVATAMYDNGVNTLQEMVTVELEASSSLRAKHGEIYESMVDSVAKAVEQSRKMGGFQSLSEGEIADYVNAESKKFADQVLAEANMRGTLIDNVLKSSDITFENGQLKISMTGGNTETLQGGNQVLEQAMYKSKLSDFGSFYDDIIKNENTKDRYFTEDINGVGLDIPRNAIRHDIKKHGLTKEEWQGIFETVRDGGIKEADLGDKTVMNGIPVKMVVDVNGVEYGMVFEHMKNGRNLVQTAFKLNDKSWMQKRTPGWSPFTHDLTVVSPGRSLSDIIAVLGENVNHTLEQSNNATIQLNNDSALISLLETADTHSLPHELAHYWLDNIFKYAKTSIASESYRQRWQAISDYLGVSPTQENLTKVQQEKWARAYEAYINTKTAPVPALRGAFDDYNKWLRRAYRRLKTQPKYRRDGKLIAPKLTPDIVNVFNSLTTGEFIARPDIELMAEKVTPDLEKAVISYEEKGLAHIAQMEKTTVYPETISRPAAIAEEQSEKSSAVAVRELNEQLGYKQKNLTEEFAKAEEWVKNNLIEAKAVVDGREAPDGLLSSAVNIAYVREMEAQGNYSEAQRATRLRSMEQTLRGQEIVMERMTTDNTLSMAYWTEKVLARRENEAALKYFSGDIQKMRQFISNEARKIAKDIAGKPAQDRPAMLKKHFDRIEQEIGVTLNQENELGQDYNELFLQTQMMIEQGLGVDVSDAEANTIGMNVEQMKMMFENTVSENGNPSIETFKKLDEMNKLIDSYTPANPGVVWSSIYGRGAMLASVKSPVLNIISNMENYITERVARMGLNAINGKSNQNIVSSGKIDAYIKWSDDVYCASGFMPSVTENVFDETRVLGETRPHSQGDGVVRSLGRIAENIVFKQLMGRPDNRFKDYTFVDVAGNKATQIAYAEGLSGEKAVARANELFDDATKINPQTELGLQVRQEAMIAAHEATYTQNSEMATVSLKIRDILNSIGGKNFKLGDTLMPFVKTPANVVQLGAEYAVGSVYTLYKIPEIVRNPASEVSQRAIRAGIRNGIGFLISLMLLSFVDDDDYIPEYDNASPKQRDLAKLKNAPFNSLKIGGKWVSLDYFGPLAVPMSGILMARQQEDIISAVWKYTQGVSSQAAKIPGVREFVDLMGEYNKAQEYKSSFIDVLKNVGEWGAEQIYSRSVPAFINDFGKLADTYERETGGELSNRIISKIPFARERLPIKSDITGRQVKGEGLSGLFFGARVKTANDNRVVREFDKLNKAGEAPTMADPTKYGTFRDLPETKKNAVRSQFNREYGKRVKAFMASGRYTSLKPEDKKKQLNKIRKQITDELKKRYIK